MGFHICGFCDSGFDMGENRFSKISSGDVNLTFENGHKWVMPDMILHYVGDHNWLPPTDFVKDVMNDELAECDRSQTRSSCTSKIYDGERVGYLRGRVLPGGVVPEDFLEQLEFLMKIAGSTGMRVVTNGKVHRGL
ncbi:MAG: hypothetical protein HY226_05255 [Candidatus Vogelbacteria bacterium]|nr:hypothetical protein [Candidatus Vogelbacteria bacterium]